MINLTLRWLLGTSGQAATSWPSRLHSIQKSYNFPLHKIEKSYHFHLHKIEMKHQLLWHCNTIIDWWWALELTRNKHFPNSRFLWRLHLSRPGLFSLRIFPQMRCMYLFRPSCCMENYNEPQEVKNMPFNSYFESYTPKVLGQSCEMSNFLHRQ